MYRPEGVKAATQQLNTCVALTGYLIPESSCITILVLRAGVDASGWPSPSPPIFVFMDDSAARLATDIRIHNSLHLLGITIMYYDYLITLDDEISFLWNRTGSVSWFWFFAVRYAGFVGNLPVTVFSFYTMEPKICMHRCHAYHLGHQVVLIGTQLIISVVMFLRIHALYGRNLRVLLSLLAIALPLLGVVVWSTLDQHSTSIDDFPGCHTSTSPSTWVFLALLPLAFIYPFFLARAYHLAASWEALFVFDALIFALTVRKTYTTCQRTGIGAGTLDLPIHELILRDKSRLTRYDSGIGFANLSNILTFYPVLAGSLSTFASCMSVSMMSRLMLNLQKQAKGNVLSTLEFPSTQNEESTIVFANGWVTPISPPADEDVRSDGSASSTDGDVEMQRILR
ncbi:hypothetical protein B0H13DRAFT_1995673 [Mycena leptocephala]|nr:hypothetical protein B0H13DRAFT_1995673 [Mycena leptocephala]